jgi:hypothetical protein
MPIYDGLPPATGELVPNVAITIPDSNATPESDITGAVGAILYMVEIDCTNNTDEDVYVRFYNKSSPTVGTDDAEVLLKGFAGKKKTYVCKRGTTFSSNLSVATVTERGATAGATNPTGTVALIILVDDVT